MLESGIAGMTMLFAVIGICVIFVAAWILKAENRIKSSRADLNRMRSRIESAGRERAMLMDALDSMEKGQTQDASQAPKSRSQITVLQQMMEQNAELERENRKMKSELDEAKASLEEIYKAVVEKGA